MSSEQERSGATGQDVLEEARHWLGVSELAGSLAHNGTIVAWLRAVSPAVTADEVSWCSAFACNVARVRDLPNPNSLRARSWLRVGEKVADYGAAQPGDVVVFRQPGGPGPDVLDAPGHVAFLCEPIDLASGLVRVCGGNQGDKVSEMKFRLENVIGIRRIAGATREQGGLL